MLVTTTERISGQEYEIIGEVFGLTTRSKNMFKDLGAGLKSVVAVKSKVTLICNEKHATKQSNV